MSDFLIALGTVAPYYDLILTLTAFYLFIKLFRIKKAKNVKKLFMIPWYFIFAGNAIHIFEEGFTVLRHYVWIPFIPPHVNGFFELLIISLFIYALLLQREYLKKNRI